MQTHLGSTGDVHSLRALGFSGRRLEQDLERLSTQALQLDKLGEGFRLTAGILSSDSVFDQAIQAQRIAPPMSVRRPPVRSQVRGYHQPPTSVFESETPPGSHLEASLRSDPFQRVRARFCDSHATE